MAFACFILWAKQFAMIAKFEYFEKLPFWAAFRDHLTSLTSGAYCGGLAKAFSFIVFKQVLCSYWSNSSRSKSSLPRLGQTKKVLRAGGGGGGFRLKPHIEVRFK